MFIPDNEMGVVALFTMDCNKQGWELLKIGIAFPDAIIKDTITGKEYRAEFEFYASSFISHGHDPAGCDMIICWENDMEDFRFPILCLQTWDRSLIFDLSADEKTIAYLTVENKKLRIQLKKLLRSEKTAYSVEIKNISPPEKDSNVYKAIIQSVIAASNGEGRTKLAKRLTDAGLDINSQNHLYMWQQFGRRIFKAAQYQDIELSTDNLANDLADNLQDT